jgi:nicotinamidase-related amidase
VVARPARDRVAVLVIDVQPRFIETAGPRAGPPVDRIVQLCRLAAELEVPVLATLEEPVEAKGELPAALESALPAGSQVLRKWTYDCLAEPGIEAAVRALGRPQVAVAGAETDVCVLQTVLSLVERGLGVFLLEDCLFSSAADTSAALERMRRAGAVPATYKSLYYELLGRVRTEALPAGLVQP